MKPATLFPEKRVTQLRDRRISLGISQLEAARRVGIARQSLASIEQGRAVPSVALALRLARLLGTTVEELFGQPMETDPVPADWASFRDPLPEEPVALGWMGDHWVAHPLEPSEVVASPGLVCGWVKEKGKTGLLVQLSEGSGSLQKGIVVAGCAPVLGFLIQRLNGLFPWQRSLWLERSSFFALQALARGWIHAAGMHLWDDSRREFNLPFVEEMLGSQRFLAVELVRWKAGLAVAPGNPLGISRVADIARKKVRVVPREPGSGAQRLLEREAAREGIEMASLAWAPLAKNHREVGERVLLGVADCGITIEPVARVLGLGFLPLQEERFDLVFLARWAEEEASRRLLGLLRQVALQAELEKLFGYQASHAGEKVA
ncbi:substrate-binding domain-containing protein [Candidatus Methylacidithermus pantelleriae]|uniref:substrate-binding domain-containing protein n=1 Tax=Candidatus Methylacidithermus pantelleriae TaxID=2744239 RepID=UPI0015D0DC65|nr:substrate-binding domain-containing protein [Candidatus Methylacidithermus pantelleriae]